MKDSQVCRTGDMKEFSLGLSFLPTGGLGMLRPKRSVTHTKAVLESTY